MPSEAERTACTCDEEDQGCRVDSRSKLTSSQLSASDSMGSREGGGETPIGFGVIWVSAVGVYETGSNRIVSERLFGKHTHTVCFRAETSRACAQVSPAHIPRLALALLARWMHMHQANVDLKRIRCRASLPLRLAPCSLAEDRAELLISSHVGPAKPRVAG
eukprot:scaffold67917_cov63-Phaeocystis_antarctica.AAC.1